MTLHFRPKHYAWLFLLFGALLAIAGLTGCMTEKKLSFKTTAHLEKWSNWYERKSDKDTAVLGWAFRKFPVKVKEGKTVYLPAPRPKPLPPVVKYVDCDSLRDAGANTQRVEVPCPPCDPVVVVDTFYKHDTVEDTRLLQLQAQEITGLRAQATKDSVARETAERKSAIRLWWIAGLGGLLAAVLFVFIKRK